MGATTTSTAVPVSEVGPHPEAALARVPEDMFGFGAILQMMAETRGSTNMASMGQSKWRLMVGKTMTTSASRMPSVTPTGRAEGAGQSSGCLFAFLEERASEQAARAMQFG